MDPTPPLNSTLCLGPHHLPAPLNNPLPPTVPHYLFLSIFWCRRGNSFCSEAEPPFATVLNHVSFKELLRTLVAAFFFIFIGV